MDSGKLNDWMQVLAIFALVASIIFVGLQMTQVQKIAIAGQYQERYAVAMEFWTSREQSSFQVERRGRALMERGGLPNGFDEGTTAAEFGSIYLYTRATIGIFDNLHFQNEIGLLPDEAWLPIQYGLEQNINGDDQMYRYVLSHYRNQFRKSFIDLCDQLGLKDP